jgi:hypothetical protein
MTVIFCRVLPGFVSIGESEQIFFFLEICVKIV